MRVLIVRLGALGDIVHAVPVAAALRRAFPDARIDWLVSATHREMLDLVPVIYAHPLARAPRLADVPTAPRQQAAPGAGVYGLAIVCLLAGGSALAAGGRSWQS